MADDSTTPPNGLPVASDDIASKQYQRIKLIHGADGVNVGDVSTTNGLPTDTRYVGGTAVSATPVGFQRVSDEPRTLFYDPFDTFDTTNRWTATTAGGGQAAAVASGRLTLGSGTTANGYAYATSQPTFLPTVPGWLGYSFVIKLESAVAANAVRFWGMGVVGGTPTTTVPLGATGNGMGFEVDASGVLKAVMYSNGARTVIDALASFQPANNNDHRYLVVYRTDRTDFYIDGLSSAQLVATASFQSPVVQTLSMLLLSVAHTVAPAASRVIDCSGLAVWDTAKGNTTISDGALPHRKVTVSASGSMNVIDPDVTASGSLTAAAQTVALTLNCDSAASVQIGGTWVGTITFEGTLDSTTWFSINGVSASTSSPQPTTTANGLYRITPGGLSAMRVNMTAFTSGTATILVRASAGTGGIFANQILPTKNTDGTSSQAIKAASTAAVAADQAAVVAISPNSNGINAAQINGVAPLMGNGVTGTGSQRVTIASDNTPHAVKIDQTTPGTTNLVALAANQTVSVSQINGVANLAGNGVTGTGSQRVTIASDNTALAAAGQGATAAAVPTGATLHGLRANTANPTNATGGNLVAAMGDKAGRTVNTPVQVRELITVGTLSIAATAETTLIAAGGAGVFNDITQLIITTAGAAAQTITLKDATAGTTRAVFNYPNAAIAPGAPLVINFNPPIPAATANANWTVTQSVATACNYTFVYAKNL